MRNILITQWFDCTDPERYSELFQCVAHNLSQRFDDVYIFHDRSTFEFAAPNVNNLRIDRRMTFRDYLQLVEQDHHQGDMMVLTNTDIQLDGRIFGLREVLKENQLIALSRYEADGTLANSPWCTQDTWVLLGQKIHQSALWSSDIPIGTPGCELRFSEVLYSVGYSVFNPCEDIRNLHVHSEPSVHKDEIRNFGAYLFTPACRFADLSSTSDPPLPSLVYHRQSL